MGKETLEEAAENHQCGGYDWQKEKRKSFIDGAKWMKEQSKAMEKEQILNAHNQGYADGYRDNGNSPIDYYNETFKQQ